MIVLDGGRRMIGPVPPDEPPEPHVNVWRFGGCVACGEADSWVVVAVPKLDTGEQYPQFGVCEICGHEVDLKDMPPFVVPDVDERWVNDRL